MRLGQNTFLTDIFLRSSFAVKICKKISVMVLFYRNVKISFRRESLNIIALRRIVSEHVEQLPGPASYAALVHCASLFTKC